MIDRDKAEIANLYHLARTVVGDDRVERLIQSAKWFQEAHPELSWKRAWVRVTDAMRSDDGT